MHFIKTSLIDQADFDMDIFTTKNIIDPKTISYLKD